MHSESYVVLRGKGHATLDPLHPKPKHPKTQKFPNPRTLKSDNYPHSPKTLKPPNPTTLISQACEAVGAEKLVDWCRGELLLPGCFRVEPLGLESF